MKEYTEIDLLHEYLLDRMKTPKLWYVEYLMENGMWGAYRGMYFSKTEACDSAKMLSHRSPHRVVHEEQIIAHYWRGVEVTITK